MKKRVLGITFGVAMLFVGGLTINTQQAEAKEDGGWFWKAETIDCTVSTSWTVGGGPIPLSYQFGESYQGQKRVCRDGWSVCLTGSCS